MAKQDELAVASRAFRPDLDRLDTEYQAIVEGLRRIEAAVARGEQDREAIRAEVAELRARVGALAQRLAELETRLSLPPGTH
jgi:predicted nuclease with TOPRIM domain